MGFYEEHPSTLWLVLPGSLCYNAAAMKWGRPRRVRRAVLVVASCLGLMGGLAWARVMPFEAMALLWLLPLFALVALRRHTWLTVLLFVAWFFVLGWWRGDAYVQKVALHQRFHQQKVTVVGTANDEAVYGPRYQLEFVLSNVRVVSPHQTPLVGNLTVRGFGEPAIYRGDVVQVTGKLYPTRGNSLGGISFAELEVLQQDSSPINELRRRFSAGLQSALPDPAASLAAGILIGQRTTLPEQTDKDLRHVGLTHIIAVSGYNLTVIVMACRRLLAGRSKFQATAACLALLGVFLLITGSNPPVVRASIVCLLGLAAWYFGRRMNPLVLLLVSAAITVLANPLYLWGSVSWYLSFLAFFGVLVLAPLLTKRLLKGREPPLLLAVLIESACATIAVLPYILFIFGEMSLVSLLANVLVVPIIPVAMLLSLFAGLAGMWLPFVAGWIAWPATTVLTYMLDVAHLLSRVPNAFIQHIEFPFWLMLASYALLGAWCLLLYHKTKQIEPAILTDKTSNKQGA